MSNHLNSHLNNREDKLVNEITFFAATNFRGQKKKFGIKVDDRRRHMYVIGKTGMGKSTLLENMIVEDIEKGQGVAVVDPHGDLVEKIIRYVPSNRVNDVVYFNPADLNYPVAFNILENVDPGLRHIVASGLIGVFKKIWADSWGPRLEYVLRNTILALLDYPGSTMLGIMRMLTDKVYRKKVIDRIADPVVKSFWVDEFSKYPDKFAVEAIAPIQNKVGQFLSNSLIRNIIGQVKSTIDMREIMDSGKILLLNLSKGRVGEDTSALLGAMMITKIQLAAMSRVDILEKDRKDFYLYVDEFQNFATGSFANILSEARKYHLNLVIAHQYIEQLDDIVRAAVFGNVGTLICFRVGATDAEELVKEFTPRFVEEDLVNLPKFTVYLKLMIDGIASEPFSAEILPPLQATRKLGVEEEKVIRVSRERYAKSRDVVEDKIVRWSGVGGIDKSKFDDGDNEPRGGNNRKSNDLPAERTKGENKKESVKVAFRGVDTLAKSAGEKAVASAVVKVEKNLSNVHQPNVFLNKIAEKQAKEGFKTEQEFVEKDPDAPTESRKYPAQCWSCNKITHLSFEPDGKRPIYCKNCLRDFRIVRSMKINEEKKQSQAVAASPSLPPMSVAIKEPAPGISLTDAWRQGPTSFQRARNIIKPTVKTPPPVLSKKNNLKAVKPGEVIKFDN